MLMHASQYHQARLHLQTLQTVEPDNTAVENVLIRLTREIEIKTHSLVEKGKDNIAKGDITNARKNLLKALAINPEHKEALNILRWLTQSQRRHKQGKQMLSLNSPISTYQYLKDMKGYTRPLVVSSEKPQKKSTFTATSKAKPSPVISVSPMPAPEVPEASPEKVTTKNIETSLEAKSATEALEQTDAESRFFARFWQLYKARNYPGLIKAAETMPEKIILPPEFRAWLFDAHLAQARSLRHQGKLKDAASEIKQALLYPGSDDEANALLLEVNNDIARELYEEGQKLLHSDLEKAISRWEMALNYNKNSAEVKHALQKAYLIRKNLSQIQKSSEN